MPRIQTDLITTTIESTKINVIAITFSEYTQDAVDLFLSILGLSLNLSIVILVALNSCLRVSTSCYAISLVGSNLVILIEPTRRILRSIFQLNLPVNLDYVFHVSFYSSVLTIVMFSIENYIAACDRHASLYKSYVIVSKTLRKLIIVWSVSVLITAMELHLYEHFEKEDLHEIYAASTIMFLVLPFFTLLLLHCAIFYELLLLKSIEGKWRQREFDNFRLSFGLTIAFLFTMVPYRIAKVVMALNPKATWCCSAKQMEILYILIKIFPIACPAVCYSAYDKFRKVLEDTIRRRCH
ncbi:hypothetical protein KPH14_008901 [Odynerus spinipes]|uniref:G-protein coupled receptors family 1 profile domain-containing protein n=1 Tax=Odynerus spinipes TaxID=1348599 RepID=A0AAD9VQC1_9HYME|nr:hypothetical protein KPH14_008901 [Odynerus spinipes]